jgi:regulator of cell morphogenesis and NO signaling
MHRDHVNTTSLLGELRRLTDNYVLPDSRSVDSGSVDSRTFLVGLADFDADTRLHIHKEEDVLFPAVLATAQASTATR